MQPPTDYGPTITDNDKLEALFRENKITRLTTDLDKWNRVTLPFYFALNTSITHLCLVGVSDYHLERYAFMFRPNVNLCYLRIVPRIYKRYGSMIERSSLTRKGLDKLCEETMDCACILHYDIVVPHCLPRRNALHTALHGADNFHQSFQDLQTPNINFCKEKLAQGVEYLHIFRTLLVL